MKFFAGLPWLLSSLAAIPCLVMADPTPTPTSTPAPASGIEGVITISPTHGGPIRVDEVSSRPLPSTTFVVRQGEQEVTSFTTDTEGRFRVALPPGKYQVMAGGESRRVGRFGPFEVEVSAGKMSSVQWACDSGMR